MNDKTGMQRQMRKEVQNWVFLERFPVGTITSYSLYPLLGCGKGYLGLSSLLQRRLFIVFIFWGLCINRGTLFNILNKFSLCTISAPSLCKTFQLPAIDVGSLQRCTQSLCLINDTNKFILKKFLTSHTVNTHKQYFHGIS